MDEHTQDHQAIADNTKGLNRAEWLAAAGLVLSALSWAYMAGVIVQQIGELDRRTAALEIGRQINAAKIETLLISNSRIETIVTEIKEQQRDNRVRAGDRDMSH
jgi:hypothetical protein